MTTRVRCIHCHHLTLSQGKCAETGQKITMPARPIRCRVFVPFRTKVHQAAAQQQTIIDG